MGENWSSFQALLTSGRPKQTDSSWFCSHTVQAPANPNPLRSHSMASKPRIVRRAVRHCCWPKSPGSDRGKSSSICRCWPLFGTLDADREPKRRAMPPTDRHPAAIGRAVLLGAVVCKQQAQSPRLAGCARRSWAAEPSSQPGGSKVWGLRPSTGVNVSVSLRNSNFDPGDAGGRGCDADGWPLDPSSRGHHTICSKSYAKPKTKEIQ